MGSSDWAARKGQIALPDNAAGLHGPLSETLGRFWRASREMVREGRPGLGIVRFCLVRFLARARNGRLAGSQRAI